MPDSVSFDRAADYYDRTRGFSEEGTRRSVALLAQELGDRGSVLEIGAGTGQLAVPLRAAGVPVIGLDLARPMLDRLRAKPGEPIPLVEADATRLPFADDALGAAYVRWVLHLIPSWVTALEELVRVVRPGGVVVAIQARGQRREEDRGPRDEIQDRFAEILGRPKEPVGLDWSDWDSLTASMELFRARVRPLPVFTDVERDDVEDFLNALRDDLYSWTWPIPEDERLRAAAQVHRWAEARFGPLDRLPRREYEIAWRAYDLP